MFIRLEYNLELTWCVHHSESNFMWHCFSCTRHYLIVSVSCIIIHE